MTTLTQRFYDRRASNLLLLWLLLHHTVGTFEEGGYWTNPGYRHPAVLAVLVAGVVLAVAAAWAVRSGKRWAKWLWVAALVYGLSLQTINLIQNGFAGLVLLPALHSLGGLLLQALALFYAFRDQLVKP